MIKVTHNNKILLFNERFHKYIIDDEEYISVTTKISDFFESFNTNVESWRYAIAHNMKQCDVIEMWKNEAAIGAGFGLTVHDYAECYILKKELPVPNTEKEEIYFEYVQKWLDKLLVYYEIVDVEKIIFSSKYKIAGTFDLLVKHKRTGKYFILDWKTNKAISFKNRWQNCINGLEEFQATDYNKFCFQLNMYKQILKNEKYYKNVLDFGMKILYINKNGISVIAIENLNKNVLKCLFKEGKNV